MPIDIETTIVNLSQRLSRLEGVIDSKFDTIEAELKKVNAKLTKASDKRFTIMLSLGGWVVAVALAVMAFLK